MLIIKCVLPFISPSLYHKRLLIGDRFHLRAGIYISYSRDITSLKNNSSECWLINDGIFPNVGANTQSSAQKVIWAGKIPEAQHIDIYIHLSSATALFMKILPKRAQHWYPCLTTRLICIFNENKMRAPFVYTHFTEHVISMKVNAS